MRYTLCLLTVFFMGITAVWAAESNNSDLYKRTIQNIYYEAVGTDTVICIECSDKTVWKRSLSSEQQVSLYQFQKGINVGAEAYLYPTKQAGQTLWLCTNNSEECFRVNFTKESMSLLPTVENVEKEVITPSGWFTDEESKYRVTLSDGSQWELLITVTSGKFCILDRWAKGHPILISRTVKGIILINVVAESGGLSTLVKSKMVTPPRS